jgi:pectate lyase
MKEIKSQGDLSHRLLIQKIMIAKRNLNQVWQTKNLTFLLVFSMSVLTVNSQQLAFPGADGYGKYVSGGRGGVVYEVTNLKDDGQPGSLRWAINQSGPRTIVFRVSGTIELNSRLKIVHGNLTIAGQTAPGDGICIKNYNFGIGASNIIIRYIRFRLGDDKTWGEDAFSGTSPKRSAHAGSLPIKSIMIDHCSISWGTDETLSVYDVENVTVQWCIISESLNRDGHGFGGIISGWGASIHHNLFAHHKSRSPRFSGGRYQDELKKEMVDMRYNVIYNAGQSYGGEGGHHNVINNYYRTGNKQIVNPSAPNPSSSDSFLGVPYDSIISTWYIDGNYAHGFTAVTADNWNGGVKLNSPAHNKRLFSPLPSAYLGQEKSAEEAFIHVLNGTGATLPKRDSVDRRVTYESRHGLITYTGSVLRRAGLVDIMADVLQGYPVLNSLPAPADTDKDGMPDDWEIVNGLDPNDPSDRNIVGDDGYTMLERYLNGIEFNNPVEGYGLKKISETSYEISWIDNYLAEDGFIIERSIGIETFIEIARVPKYTQTYIDKNVIAEEGTQVRYRVVAFNEHNETPRTSDFGFTTGMLPLETSANNVKLFPNPFTSHSFLEITSDAFQTVTIKLFDITGRQVGTTLSIGVDIGVNRFELPVADFKMNPGVYICALSFELTQSVKSVMIVKH